ncbi:MAG TPA: ABC transporter permease [Mucilaginibacter sp.]|nr:ABC transporter permease [Mucilaginibacter sp.]
MIRYHIKIAWRNLIRNRGFAVTNLLGLTIGITCVIFIFLWVKDELTFDRFNPNYNSIYQVIANRDFKNSIFTDRNMVFPLETALQNSNPQIKNVVMTTYQETQQVNYGNNKVQKNALYFGGRYFDMFPWKFIEGTPASVTSDPFNIAITASAAKSLFGNADPINKTLKIDNSQLVKVAAVIADPPGNSSQQFDYLGQFNFNSPDAKKQMLEWVNSSWQVFIQTTPGANPDRLGKFVTHVMKSHNHDKISTYFLFPMSKWHLYSDFKDGKNAGGMIEYVKLFTIIAIIILLIACMNFMNLSTARSEKRAKEVGIRKTLGSDKRQLTIQFFVESMILVLIAFVFALLAVFLLLPSFNLLVSKQLHLNLQDPIFWVGALVIILFTGIIAGSYPALYLSSFNPVKVLKGTFQPGKKAIAPRRVLVVAQFIGCIVLISATIIVYKQIQHVKDRSLGYDQNNLVMVDSTPSTDKNFNVIKQDMMRSGMFASVTRSSSPITEISWRTGAPDWDGRPANTNIIMSAMATDLDFAKTVGAAMLKGTDFTGMPSDSVAMLLNKAAVNAMQLKNPIGMQMRYGRQKFTVIGVIDNLVISSPYQPVEPMLIFCNRNSSSEIMFRPRKGVDPAKTIQFIQKEYQTYSPADIFKYEFADQEFGKKFASEELISKLTDIFAGLAIFISCMGLAGLASFTTEKRTREIGIRKVLGASVNQLVLLISREFIKLVAIAFIIATPVSWWLMHNWLNKYDYHTDISLWIFAIVGAVVLLLTLAVVCLNTLGAALANP